MVNRTVVVGLGLVLLAGCSSASQASDPSGSPSESTGATAAARGQRDPLHLAVGHQPPGRGRSRAHPIGADGSIGAAAPVLSGPADDTSFPGVVDGIGPTALTGSYTDYWTTDLQVRSGGQVSAEVAAPRWCGGEGLTYNLCTLLDADPRGAHDRAGPGPGDRRGTHRGVDPGVVADRRVDDLRARPLRRPVDDARHRLAGRGAHRDHAGPVRRGPQRPQHRASTGRLRRPDRRSSATHPPAGCRCVRSGRTPSWASPPRAPHHRPRWSARRRSRAVTWDQQDSVVGCSADGQFLYVQRIPQPPTEETEDTEPPNPATALERISLADGSRSRGPDPGAGGDRRSGHALADPTGSGRVVLMLARTPPQPTARPAAVPSATAANPSPIVSAA